MMEVVQSHQQEAETAAAALVARLQSSPDLDAVEETHALALRVLSVWSQLPDELILKFADGYNTPTYRPLITKPNFVIKHHAAQVPRLVAQGCWVRAGTAAFIVNEWCMQLHDVWRR